MRTKKHTGRDDVVKKVAIGATGVALTAGAIAAGVALSNKKTRKALVKKAGNTFKRVGSALPKSDRFQAVTHKIGLNKKSTKVKPKRGTASKHASSGAVPMEISRSKSVKKSTKTGSSRSTGKRKG